jgi:hypothetical protein
VRRNDMSRIVLVAVGFVACSVAPLHGQTSSTPAEPFGRIFSGRVRSEVKDFARKLRAPGASFTLLSLSLQDSESATGGSLSAGYGGSLGGRDFYLSGSYSHSNPDDSGDSSNSVSAYGQLALLTKGHASLTGAVTAAYDPDTYEAYGFLLIADETFLEDKLTATANLGWTEINLDDGESVNDLQPALGLSFSPNQLWTFSADYTFENDADGEDTGSFAASYKMNKISSKLKLTGTKHNAYTLALTKSF